MKVPICQLGIFNMMLTKDLAISRFSTWRKTKDLAISKKWKQLEEKQEVLHEDLAKFSPLSLTPCFLDLENILFIWSFVLWLFYTKAKSLVRFNVYLAN